MMSGWTLAEFFRHGMFHGQFTVSYDVVLTELLGYLALGILGGALLTWTTLWLTPAILLYSCIVYWPLTSIIEALVFQDRAHDNDAQGVLLTLNGIIVFVTSLVLLHRAWRKGGLTPKALLLMAALAPLVAAGSVLLVAGGQLDVDLSAERLPGFLLLYTPLPFVPVAAVPLVLDRLRHR
jgi:hypothetical protein